MSRDRDVEKWPPARVVAELATLETYDHKLQRACLAQKRVLVPMLREAMRGADSRAKEHAALLLLHLGHREGTNGLLELIRDDETRFSALCSITLLPCREVGSVKGPWAALVPPPVPLDRVALWCALEALVADPRSEHHELAVTAATRFSTPAAEPALLQLLRSPSPKIRLTVAQWLAGRGEDRGALDTLAELRRTQRRDYHTCHWVISALKDYAQTDYHGRAQEIASSYIDEHWNKTGNDSYNIVLNALKVLHGVNDEVQRLQRLTRSRSSVVRELAAKRLGELATLDHLSALRDADARKAAGEALTRIARTQRYVPPLIEALENELAKAARKNVLSALMRALLVHGGAGEAALTKAARLLDPWDWATVHWTRRSMTPRSAAEQLARAKVIAKPGAKGLKALTARWKERPDVEATICALFADQLVTFDCEAGEVPPDYIALIDRLADASGGALRFEDGTQTQAGKFVRVTVVTRGRAKTFKARLRGDWFDVPAVVAALNGMLAETKAAERYFVLSGVDQEVSIICARRSETLRAAKTLSIPFEHDADAAMKRGQAYESHARRRSSTPGAKRK